MAVNAVSPTTAPAAAIGASGATATSSSKDGGFDAMLAKLRGEGSGASGAAKPTADADTEDRFLKLLVAQMNNQDPLNPLDNSQVTSQLAQINTVKGIDKLNTALQTLIERTGTGLMMLNVVAWPLFVALLATMWISIRYRRQRAA